MASRPPAKGMETSLMERFVYWYVCLVLFYLAIQVMRGAT